MGTTTTSPRAIAGADLALVFEALEHHETARPVLLYGIEAGTIQIVESGPGLPPPNYCKAGGEIDRSQPGGRGHELLTLALARAAGRWAAMGHPDDAGDCWRLVARLRAGALQMIGNHSSTAQMER